MAESDVAMKVWLKNKERFADFFNGIVFNGRQVIKPDELEVVDSEADIVVTDKDKNNRFIQRHRDVVMRWSGEMNLAILAIENQTSVNNAMPVRVMVYDALSYDEQLKELHEKKKRKNSKKGYKRKSDYYSSFSKKDSIHPVISIVFYYGSKPWNSNKTLYDMFKNIKDSNLKEILRKYAPDYRINLVNAMNLTDVEKFKTDLQMVLGMIKCRESKDELAEYIDKNSSFFESVERDTINVMAAVLNMEKIKEYASDLEKGERGNMCKALQDMWNEAEERGEERGSAKRIYAVVRNMLNKGMDVSEICELAECSQEYVEQVRKEL